MRDSDVRSAVRQQLDAQHAGDPDTRIVEEMGLWSGSVRIDIAVINGELCGFELKSDSDTLERLPAQADIYSRVFDRVELVVGNKHAAKAQPMVPSWWGIIVASQRGEQVDLTSGREGQINPARDPYLIAQLLWKEEAILVLEKHGLAAGWRSKTVKKIHERIASELEIDDLRKTVRAVLKSRVGWLGKPIANKLNVPVHSDLNPCF